MPKIKGVHRILVLGSGPVVIGQGAEFDYSGTQACRALRDLGYEVILINSNPATVMTDTAIADRVYVEPMTFDFVAQILRKEMPDAVLPTFGGPTSLNMALKLAKAGILKELEVEVLGTPLSAIEQVQDRKLFKQVMAEINEPSSKSVVAKTTEEALAFINQTNYPVIVKPALTLGSIGAGIASDQEQLLELVNNGIKLSPVKQVFIEESLAGYQEILFEVMRDDTDNVTVVANMENFDPVGIHTGDSITYIPCQTVNDFQIQKMRDSAINIVKKLAITGCCEVQFAFDSETGDYYIIEVKPRTSRASALASKATGYPIAEFATRVAVGLSLKEINHPLTKGLTAQHEPVLDYVVAKIPRWPFDHQNNPHQRLDTQMKATGEVMAFGTSIEQATLKAIHSLQISLDYMDNNSYQHLTEAQLLKHLIHPTAKRIFYLIEALRREYHIEDIAKMTKINAFFLNKLANIVQIEKQLLIQKGDLEILKKAKKMGFSDLKIANMWQITPMQLRKMRIAADINANYHAVDASAGLLPARKPYYYSTYESENESAYSDKPAILIVGPGPSRIGQGLEFDYSTVHCINAVKHAGYQAVYINSSPETNSTDYLLADKLYIEPVFLEHILDIVALEKPAGVILQFAGQSALDLTHELQAYNVPILGMSQAELEQVLQPNNFELLLKRLNIKQPANQLVHSKARALEAANQIGYPVLVRPSETKDRRAAAIIRSDEDFNRYFNDREIADDSIVSIRLKEYLLGKECDLDAITDGEDVLVPGILEHIERSGIHSGDSMAVYPPQSLTDEQKKTIVGYTKAICKVINAKGFVNLHFIIQNEQIYIVEINPRASRTVPFFTKVTKLPLIAYATRILLGATLKELNLPIGLLPGGPLIHVKAPVFSFSKLTKIDRILGPEMKSTGEVMGSDITMQKALYKAFEASGLRLPNHGTILMTVTDEDKATVIPIAQRFRDIGYQLVATIGTTKVLQQANIPVKPISKIKQSHTDNLLQAIQAGQVQMVVNTTAINESPQVAKDSMVIRQTAIECGIPLLTSLDTVNEILMVLESRALLTQPI